MVRDETLKIQGLPLEKREKKVKKITERIHKIYPIHDDQLQLVERLKQVKWRMQNTSVLILGETLTLWKLADVQDNLENPALSSRFDHNTVI